MTGILRSAHLDLDQPVVDPQMKAAGSKLPTAGVAAGEAETARGRVDQGAIPARPLSPGIRPASDTAACCVRGAVSLIQECDGLRDVGRGQALSAWNSAGDTVTLAFADTLPGSHVETWLLTVDRRAFIAAALHLCADAPAAVREQLSDWQARAGLRFDAIADGDGG